MLPRDWLQNKTKEAGLDKLRRMFFAVGQPAYWDYYNGVYLEPDKYLWNGLQLSEWYIKKSFRRLVEKVYLYYPHVYTCISCSCSYSDSEWFRRLVEEVYLYYPHVYVCSSCSCSYSDWFFAGWFRPSKRSTLGAGAAHRPQRRTPSTVTRPTVSLCPPASCRSHFSRRSTMRPETTVCKKEPYITHKEP